MQCGNTTSTNNPNQNIIQGQKKFVNVIKKVSWFMKVIVLINLFEQKDQLYKLESQT
jgi:hypothetical protein